MVAAKFVREEAKETWEGGRESMGLRFQDGRPEMMG